jgi:prephenate dehydrogenase
VIRRLTLIGLGLLGGSIAKAVRREGLAREIVAVGRQVERLQPAVGDGVVDRATADVALGVAGADLCVLCTPVTTLAALLPAVWGAAPAECVITDVGSTKAHIVDTAARLAAGRPLAFVGSHPMAGSEQSGYAAARPDLFRGALVVVTPGEAARPDAVKRVSELWEALGARVVAMEPRAHDRAVAAVSHLPHLVADALVAAVLRMDPRFVDVAGAGFRDTTRIAASSPAVWREIFQDNRVALREAVGAFRSVLDELEALVTSEADAAIEAELERIRRARAALPERPR